MKHAHRHYVVFGQRLCSDLPLPELTPARFQTRDLSFRCIPYNGKSGLLDETARLLTRRSTDLGYDISVYENNHGYLLRWEGRCDFQVSSDGRTIGYQGAPGCGHGWIKANLYGVILSFALLIRGVGNLHASAVVLSGGAVGFLAQPGSGKSTLAASFAAAGHPFLTDDVLALAGEGAEVQALPGFPYASLTPDAVDHIWGNSVNWELPHLNQEKVRVHLNGASGGFCASPVRLRALYLLERGESAESVEISRETQALAVQGLLGETNTLPLLPKEALSQHLAFVAKLVSRVPVWRLSYPSSFKGLEQVRKAVLAHHQQIIQAVGSAIRG